MNYPSTSFCHQSSAQNYFNSPKMPVKDHIEGLKFTSSKFKQQQPFLDKTTKKILGDHSLSTMHIGQIVQMKEMKLMNSKELCIVNHNAGKENSCVGSHHDRQTNPGYSRNALGGFFTS